MSAPAAPGCDKSGTRQAANRSSWTKEFVQSQLSRGGESEITLIQAFYDWDIATWKKAEAYVKLLLGRKGIIYVSPCKPQFPSYNGKQHDLRVDIEAVAMHERPELFKPKYLYNQKPRPDWYVNGMMRGDAAEPTTSKGKDTFKTVFQHMLDVVWRRIQLSEKQTDGHEEMVLKSSPPLSNLSNKRNASESSLASLSPKMKHARVEARLGRSSDVMMTESAVSQTIQDAEVWFAILEPGSSLIKTKKMAKMTRFLDEKDFEKHKTGAFDLISQYKPAGDAEWMLFWFCEERIMQITMDMEVCDALWKLHKAALASQHAMEVRLLLFWAINEEDVEVLPPSCRVYTIRHTSKGLDYSDLLSDDTDDTASSAHAEGMKPSSNDNGESLSSNSGSPMNMLEAGSGGQEGERNESSNKMRNQRTEDTHKRDEGEPKDAHAALTSGGNQNHDKTLPPTLSMSLEKIARDDIQATNLSACTANDGIDKASVSTARTRRDETPLSIRSASAAQNRHGESLSNMQSATSLESTCDRTQAATVSVSDAKNGRGRTQINAAAAPDHSVIDLTSIPDPEEDPYKWVIKAKPLEEVVTRHPGTLPFDPEGFPLAIKYEPVDYLSTQIDIPDEPDRVIDLDSGEEPLADETEANDQLVESVLAKESILGHMSTEFWRAACLFFGRPASEVNPNSKSFWESWKPNCGLYGPQMYIVAWVIRNLTLGYPLQVICASAGSGKTAMALSTIVLLSDAMQCATSNFGSHVVPQEPDERPMDTKNSRFNLQQLANTSQPVIREGCIMIIAARNLLEQWIREAKKFLAMGKSSHLKFVLVHEKQSKNRIKGVYHPKDAVKMKDLPSRKEFEAFGWSSKAIDDILTGKKTISVRELLTCSDNNQGYGWMGRWIICTAPQTIDKWFYTVDHRKTSGDPTARRPPKGCSNEDEDVTRLMWPFAYVVVDEFHLYKNLSTTIWPTVANLIGRPAIIALSATPFATPEDMWVVVAASLMQYCSWKDNVDPCKLNRPNYQAAWADRKIWFKQTYDSLTLRILRKLSWITIADCAHTLSKDVTGRLSETRSIACLSSEEIEAQQLILTRFAEWLSPQFIMRRAHMRWQPDPAFKACLPFQGPVNAAFDITIDTSDEIGSKAAAAEFAAHSRSRAALLREGKDTQTSRWSFLAAADQAKVFTIFPSLKAWMDADETLANELGNFTLEYISAMRKRKIQNTKFGTYVPRLEEMKAFIALAATLRRCRETPNVYGHKPKIMCLVHKPFINFLIHTWATSLENSELRTGEDRLFKPGDTVEVCSGMDTAQKEEAIARFVGQNNQQNYTPDPWFFLGRMGAEGHGQNFETVSIVILFDIGWKHDHEIQASGRHTRYSNKAKFVHTLRFVHVAEGLEIMKMCKVRNMNRNILVSKLDEVARKALEAEEADDTLSE